MRVRDVIGDRHQAANTAIHKIIKQFDEAEITGQEMSERIGKTLHDVIDGAFDFGFMLGVTYEPDDLADGETALDLRLEEIDPEDPDAP